MAPDDGLEGVVDGVLRASRALVAVAARSIASVDDTVTLPQFRTLVALAARGPQNVGALATSSACIPRRPLACATASSAKA